MRVGVFAAVLLVCSQASAAWGAKFGGFSQDGLRYLEGDSKVCAPIDAIDDGTAIGAPACERVTDKKEIAAFGFKKPRATRETAGGKIKLSAAFEGKKIELKGAMDGKDYVLARWEGSEDVDAVGEMFVSADGALVALDYTTRGLRGKLPATVAFNIQKPMAVLQAPPVEKGKAKPAGNAYDRAMKHGGTWEQTLVPCDLARVTLKLKKKGTYTIRIETRCQGDKWVSDFDGKWIAEGDDTVVLQLENEDGPTESMSCKLTVSDEAGREKEDALTCQQEDVTFTMKPVKR